MMKINSDLHRLFLFLFFITCGFTACGDDLDEDQDWGKVELVSPTITGDELSANEVTSVVEQFWATWLAKDGMTTLNFTSDDIIYISQQTTKRANGYAELEALFYEEWSAYETTMGGIAMNIEITDFEIEIYNDAAKVNYWIQSVGGVRWDFDDQAFVSQLFTKIDNDWELVYHHDSWGLNYDNEEAAAFEFDYVYPVEDIERASAFYTPLLGEPEIVLQDRVTYFLEGVRFHLCKSMLGDYVQIEAGLPSGYALFQVEDLNSEKARLQQEGLTVLHETQFNEGVGLAVFEDTGGNIFTISEQTFDMEANEGPDVLLGGLNGELGGLAATVVEALATMDNNTLESFLNSESVWFDDTRDRTLGLAKGTDAILQLIASNWQYFDQSTMGVAAKFEPNELLERNVGPWRVASFQLKKTGLGNNPFRENNWVSLCFDADNKIRSANITRTNPTNGFVKEFDYTAHPVESLSQAENFYTNIMGLGQPYTDTGWRGYWSSYSVYGIYKANMAQDGIPRQGLANGYVSFWVDSAQETYQYLQEKGVDFPIIPAINDKSGVDEQPGYTQILATDSEGNVVLFTEYH